jgi:hypothetical protein
LRVAFFWPEDPASARALDPDRDWRKFHVGEACWVLQTYLRLAAAGYPVELTSAIPEEAVLVYHPRHRRQLEAAGDVGRIRALVAIRAERTRPLLGHFEILQSGWGADGRRRFYVPHWPQPGLIPRQESRGSRLETLAYKGFLENLHPGFLTDTWVGFLADHGIRWIIDARPWRELRSCQADTSWNDFSTTDAILAVRPRRFNGRLKPASKLLNAWRAGVPALLGPEHAYRELRRSPLDYLEVDSVAEARDAVRRLCARADLHRAMIEQGAGRAAEYSLERLLDRWAHLLFDVLPERAAVLGRRPPRWARLLPVGPRWPLWAPGPEATPRGAAPETQAGE